MPRHLITCVDILHGWGPPSPQRMKETALAAAYMRASGGWFELGLPLSEEARGRVIELWKELPEQRPLLAPLVYGYPCEEFKRPFYRHAERGGVGNYRAWFKFDPSLRGYLHRFVVQHAQDTSDRGRALDAAVGAQARHADWGGGDERLQGRFYLGHVRTGGFEPPRLSAPAPKAGASTSSATPARAWI